MRLGRRRIVLIALVLLLAAAPPVAVLLGQPFYVDLLRRVMIFAIAAVSLDLILGYGGMISFGHAAYLGVGAYAVTILAVYGVHDGLLQPRGRGMYLNQAGQLGSKNTRIHDLAGAPATEFRAGE